MSEDPRKAALLEQARAHLFRSSKDYGEPIIARGSGATLVDTDGKEYLDFGSGQMAASIGHNHPAITEALKRSSERILHLNTHLVSEEVIELGKSLADLLPQQLQKVLLLSTGGESTEVALKVAKMFTGRFEVVGLVQGYHGHTGGAMSVTFSNARGGYGPWVPGSMAIPTPYCYRCPLSMTFPSCDYACAKLGFDMVDSQSTGSLAAFIAEPILSAAGIIEPPPGYFPFVKRMCEERGMLFILDEAQTGLGRVGCHLRLRAGRRRAGHTGPVQDARRGAAPGGDGHLGGNRAGLPRQGDVLHLIPPERPIRRGHWSRGHRSAGEGRAGGRGEGQGAVPEGRLPQDEGRPPDHRGRAGAGSASRDGA